jgi:hypothetical protein
VAGGGGGRRPLSTYPGWRGRGRRRWHHSIARAPLLRGDPRVFPAVVASAGGALSDLRSAGPETPLDERIARRRGRSVDRMLAVCADVVAARRSSRGPASVRAAPLRDRVHSRSSDGIRRRTPGAWRFGHRHGVEFDCRAFKWAARLALLHSELDLTGGIWSASLTPLPRKSASHARLPLA